MKKYLITFILSTLLLSSLLMAQTISITTGEWAPWTSEKLKNNGVAIDIVTQILKSQGIDSKVVFYPWKRAYSRAQYGLDDATAVWFKNKKRAAEFHFSNEIFSIENVIIYKKGKQISFNHPDDLKQYKIAIMNGSSYGQRIDDMINLKEIKTKIVITNALALKQLLYRDFFDIFLCSKSTAKIIIADNFTKEEEKLFKFYPKPVLTEKVYLLVSKQIKDSQKIITAFNKGLKEFKEKGLIKKMINDSYMGKYK